MVPGGVAVIGPKGQGFHQCPRHPAQVSMLPLPSEGCRPSFPSGSQPCTRLKPQPGPKPLEPRAARQRRRCPMSLLAALASGYGPPPPPLRDPAGRGPPPPNALRYSARGPDPATGGPNPPPPETIEEATPVVDGEQQPHPPPPSAPLRPHQAAGRALRLPPTMDRSSRAGPAAPAGTGTQAPSPTPDPRAPVGTGKQTASPT
jgi:hypothetical protein